MTRPQNRSRGTPGASAHRPGKPAAHSQPATGLARALSKLGFCSRSQAWNVIQEGRVRVNGNLRRDPEFRVNLSRDKIVVDEEAIERANHVYVMLNKPRGLVTSVADEQGRETVYSCLQGLPFIGPVGRLDKASEGLLLLTNDTSWAARITDPVRKVEKTYHVQIDCVAEKRSPND
jgi:23S rRNA pseudouridine2605 synthase